MRSWYNVSGYGLYTPENLPYVTAGEGYIVVRSARL